MSADLGGTLNENFAAILRRHLSQAGRGQELTPDVPLKGLGLDSLQAVTLMLELEDEFGITLPDSSLTAGAFDTAATLWAAIEIAGGALVRENVL